MSEQKLKIGITQGDPNGIGWEVILKALADPRMTELFTPVIYGSPKAAAYYRNTLRETEPVQFAPAASAAEADAADAFAERYGPEALRLVRQAARQDFTVV